MIGHVGAWPAPAAAEGDFRPLKPVPTLVADIGQTIVAGGMELAIGVLEGDEKDSTFEPRAALSLIFYLAHETGPKKGKPSARHWRMAASSLATGTMRHCHCGATAKAGNKRVRGVLGRIVVRLYEAAPRLASGIHKRTVFAAFIEVASRRQRLWLWRRQTLVSRCAGWRESLRYRKI